MKLLICFFIALCFVSLGYCSTRRCKCLRLPKGTKLRQFHGGCTTNSKNRHPDCVAAMSRYCNQIKFPWIQPERPLMAASREHAYGRIHFSCIQTTRVEYVTLSELRRYHGGCRRYKSQSSDCLAAINRYCSANCNGDHAGMAQEVPYDGLYITCFKSSLKVSVPIPQLRRLHRGCRARRSNSDDCFAAASRWCGKRGHTGGITQEVGGNRITVACYKAVYSTVRYAWSGFWLMPLIFFQVVVVLVIYI